MKQDTTFTEALEFLFGLNLHEIPASGFFHVPTILCSIITGGLRKLPFRRTFETKQYFCMESTSTYIRITKTFCIAKAKLPLV